MIKSEKGGVGNGAMTVENGQADEESSFLAKMKAVFDNLPFNSWVKDSRGVYIAVNKTFADSAGLSDDAILGKTDGDIYAPGQAAKNKLRDRDCIQEKKKIQFEETTADGRVMEFCLSPVVEASGEIVGIAGFSRDITDAKISEAALLEREERLKRAQAMAHIGNWEMDKGDSTVWASEEFFKIFGFEQAEERSLPYDRIRQAISGEDLMKNDVAFKLLMEKNRDYDLEYRIKRPGDGAERFVRSSAVMEKDGCGAPYKVFGVIQDITDIKMREEQIKYLNRHDLLTGVYNRTSFEKELRRWDNEKGLPLSLIMVDVNGLKLTNDMFGHSEGDRLLIGVAKILKDCCPIGGRVARVGGDEFCMLLPRTSAEIARSISAQILRACEISNGANCLELICPSVSLGYATKRDPEEPISNVMNEAEAFMQKRKLLERKSLRSSVLSSIKTTLFEKSHETEEHAERLVELSRLVGMEMGLTDSHLYDLSLLASLHDIGKLSIDEYILCKPGKLTDEEWAEIRRHPEVGYRIAKSSPELMAIADYILCHHERWDGKGYPQGLKSRNIPLLSRILAVVDAYDAMTQDRAYRKATAKESAIDEIIRHSGTQFDPDVAIVFIKTMQNRLS